MASVYTAVITGDEMISSAFPMKEVDNAVYESTCQLVQVKKSSAVGVDPETKEEESEEEEQEEEEDKEEFGLVNNIADSFALQKTTFTKSAYLSHLKGYKDRVKTHLASEPDQAEEFDKSMQSYARKVISHFPEYEFYTGRNKNTMGMIALLRTPDGDERKSYFVF